MSKINKYIINKIMENKNEFEKDEIEEVLGNIKIWSKVYQIIMVDFFNKNFSN